MQRGDVSERSFGARWARWATRRRAAILWSALLVGIAAAPIAARLPLHGDMSYLLPPQTRSVIDLHALEARARVFGTIIVAIESDDADRRSAAARLIRDRLAAVPGGAFIEIAADSAARDRFVWEHRHLLAPTEDLTAVRDELASRKARLNPLFVSLDDDAAGAAGGPALGDRLREMNQRLAAAKAGAEHPAEIVSKDGRLQIVVARTGFPSGEVSRNAPAVEAVKRAVDEARRLGGSGVRIGITGDVVNAAAEHHALLGGMVRATLFTVVIVALGMLLFFRSVVGVAALLAALALGSLATFAFTRLAVGHLNLATAFLAPIVVGNGINFGIILLARYFEERRKRTDPVAALGAAVQGSLGGTLAAALTASVSYASLIATDFRGFRHFGLIGGVGILFCWAATFLVLPAAIAVLEARGLAGGRTPVRLGNGLARLQPRRRPAIVLTAFVALVGSGIGACKYVASHPFEKDFKNLRSSAPEMRETWRWNESIDRAFGRGVSGGTVIALPTRERAREVAEKMRAADRGRPAAERLFARVSTLDDLVPPDQDAKRALLSDIHKLLTKQTLAAMTDAEREAARALDPPAQVDRIADGDVPPELAWPFVEKDGTRGRLIVAMTGAGFDLWRTEDLERFVATFRGLGLGSDLIVGGNAFVQRDIVQSVNRDGPRASLIAAVGAAIVVVLILGATRQAAITLLCGAAGVFMLLSAASVLGIRINFLDFVALPITIGIGIDYSVNIAARHRAEGRGSAARILVAAGPAVALCSYTTVVGYASLLFSANQGIRSFGFAALIGEVTCIAAAIALAPALLDFRVRRKSRGATTASDPQSRRGLTGRRYNQRVHGNPMVIPTVAGAFLLFWLGRIIDRRARKPGQVRAVSAVAAVVALPGILFALYYLHLYDDAPWFYGFRSLPGTELSACGLGFTAGVAQARLRADSAGKILVPLVLVLLVLGPFVKPIISPVEFGRPRVQPGDGTVLQSTRATCGPASAATLLNLLGRPATEQQLAAESFTSMSGTENWYLARALRRRGLDVTFEFRPVENIAIPSPAIAGVVLPGGRGHFIAILNSTESDVTFADPIDGRHTADRSELLNRYRFTGFFMVVRARRG